MAIILGGVACCLPSCVGGVGEQPGDYDTVAVQLASTDSGDTPRAPYVEVPLTSPATAADAVASRPEAQESGALRQMLTKFRALDGSTSFVMARLIESPRALAGDERVSEWIVSRHIAGPPVPTTFKLVEFSPGGQPAVDFTITPLSEHTYPMLVRRSERSTQAASYELVDDGVNIRSLLTPLESHSYRMLGDWRTIKVEDVLAETGRW